MANTIHVDIVSAEGQIFAGEASMVFAPASEGEIGIAPRHAPLLTMLKAGEVRVQTEGADEQSFFIGGGALEVQPNAVTVLADTAVRAKDLDEAAALEARRRAQDAVREKTDKIELAEAQAELLRAIAQLRAIERLRKTALTGDLTKPADPTMQLSVVILAAGQGQRMNSDLPKVLQPLAGRPLLSHVIDAAQSLAPAENPRRLRPRRFRGPRGARRGARRLGPAGRAARHRPRDDAGDAAHPECPLRPGAVRRCAADPHRNLARARRRRPSAAILRC